MTGDEGPSRWSELRGLVWAGLLAFVATAVLGSAARLGTDGAGSAAGPAAGPARSDASESVERLGAGAPAEPHATDETPPLLPALAEASTPATSPPEGVFEAPGGLEDSPEPRLPGSPALALSAPSGEGGDHAVSGVQADVVAPQAALPFEELLPDEEDAIVERARRELDLVTTYDASWREIPAYPMGDIASDRGACTDVVVRSLRAVGIDLQQLVHEDLEADRCAYGVMLADPNIDHRRLRTMFTFLRRNALSLSEDPRDKASFRPGDIVFMSWKWPRSAQPEHVAIVSDRVGARGLPMLIENGGPRPVESDSLGRGKIVGHFRAVRPR